MIRDAKDEGTAQEINLEELARPLTTGPGADLWPRAVKIIRLMARGRPVSIEEMATETRMPLGETKAFLTRLGGEFDHDGNLAGLGLTMKRTPHRFLVNRHKLYAWCAFDSFIFPLILNQTARVESIDPVTREKIRLTITPEGVERVEPNSTVLSWSTKVDLADIRGSVCAFGHWFSSPVTASKYAAKHPGTVILTLDEVQKMGRIISRVLPE